MSRQHSMILSLAIAVLVGLLAGRAWAGPEDQGTRYPVGIEVGGKSFGGIVDSGGTTSLSYEDAKKAGLIDDNGDPKPPHVGTPGPNLGGTGGASVATNKFTEKVKVTPRNADGTSNGEAREVEVTVFVPKKPSEQSGADDAAKARKTASLTTKLGANVVGATIGDGHITLVDKSTKNKDGTVNKAKNDRSTGWSNPPPPPPPAPPKPPVAPEKKVPMSPRPPLDDIPDYMANVSLVNPLLGGHSFQGTVETTMLPATLIPQTMAQQLGLFSGPIGTGTIDGDMQSALFTEGYFGSLNHLPGDGAMGFQTAYLNVVLPALDGPFQIDGVKVFINPYSDRVLLGGNGLVPSDYVGWLDSSDSTFNLAASPVPLPPAVFLAIGCLPLLIAARKTGWRTRQRNVRA